MNTADLSRLEHAEQIVQKGLSAIVTDFDNGYYWISSGHSLKATVQIKNDDSAAASTVNSWVNETVRALAISNKRIDACRQNEIMLLSLYTRNISGAVTVAKLTPDTNDVHPFDATLNNHLRSALGQSKQDEEKTYDATPAESGLFLDIDAVARGASSTLRDTDKFWASLRHKRYANSVFEYKNIFRGALETLQHGI